MQGQATINACHCSKRISLAHVLPTVVAFSLDMKKAADLGNKYPVTENGGTLSTYTFSFPNFREQSRREALRWQYWFHANRLPPSLSFLYLFWYHFSPFIENLYFSPFHFPLYGVWQLCPAQAESPTLLHKMILRGTLIYLSSHLSNLECISENGLMWAALKVSLITSKGPVRQSVSVSSPHSRGPTVLGTSFCYISRNSAFIHSATCDRSNASRIMIMTERIMNEGIFCRGRGRPSINLRIYNLTQ